MPASRLLAFWSLGIAASNPNRKVFRLSMFDVFFTEANSFRLTEQNMHCLLLANFAKNRK